MIKVRAQIIRVLGAAIALLSFEGLAATGNYPDVRVIESSESGVTLEFTPQYTLGQKILGDGKVYQTIEFGRNSSWNYANAGKPDVRFRTIAIGVRGKSNNRVSVISSDFQTLTGFPLAPVPALAPSQKEPGGKLYKESSSAFRTFSSPPLALMDNVAMVKGTYVGYLRIFPVQYSGTAGTLKKYSKIVVRVDFGPRERATATKTDDDWMRISLLNYPVVKRSLPASIASQKSVLTNSVLSSGTWYKLQVESDGMYKIDATYLNTLGIDRSSIPSIRDLKIYGGNGMTLPADLTQPRPADLTQLAVLYVDVNGNSKFDPEDYILFYGQGVTGWTYDPGSKHFSHYINHYTNSNEYFLQYAPGTGNGRQMAAEQSPGSGTPVTTTLGKVYFEEEKTNFVQSGLQWYSAPMNPNDSRVIVNKLDGFLPGSVVTYNYEMLSRSDATTVFTMQESGQQIATLGIQATDDASTNAGVLYYASVGDGQTSTIPALVNNNSTLKIIYNASSAIATGYINWIEITYKQQLTAVGDALLFTSPDTTASVEYDLSGYSASQFSVFDITDSVKVMQPQADQIAGTYFFRDNLTAGNVKRYWAGTTAAYKTPVSFTRIPNTNLHAEISGADFIIITHHDFISEALRLKAHKESLPGGDALKTFVVEVDTLYNEFGNGLPDPVAIRDFLEYATTQWQLPPRYVLFFGDACFDYKNILNLDKNWVPTYETPESNYQISTYAYDDFFAYLQPGNTLSVGLATGRLAVRSLDEARLTVDRIIQYESAPTFGTWRNLITIVSDDRNINGILDDAPNPEQADSLARTDVPEAFDLKKIYEEAYPTVIASTGRTKPEVRQAIIDQVNRGTLVMNYTGHGNPTVWSHETILTRDDVLSQFFNGNMLTFFVAATCDWGRFDDAASQSSAEDAIVNPNGGAIAVITPDREVYSDQNFDLNQLLYQNYFSTDPYSLTPRLGDGLMLTKNNNALSDNENNRKYHFLGDPTLRLGIPRLVMQVDSINGKPISNATFDTLQALSKVTVTASIRDVNGNIQRNFNSDSALVTIFDAEPTDSVYDSDVGHSFTFLVPGATIYRGDNTIDSGRVKATFIIPKDISYENKQGKVSVYFSGEGTDGRGYTDRVIVGGTSTSLANDTQGPTINIYFDTRSFHSGDLVTENPTLIVDLTDSSGINDAGSGVGHGLNAWLDGDPKGIDLTDFYTGAKNNYQAGTIQYQFTGLAAGQHTLTVRAWDVYNNSSTSQVAFSVASATSLALENVFNIPDPVRSTTTFTFQHNQLSPINVEIKIYTVAGRLIQVLSTNGYPDKFVQIPWDCRDRDGSKVANGTYFYKVVAKTIDGKFTNEALGKLSIVR
ncbi:MAG: type IX secretion system sortase PorU [Bacteroidota bacterium]